MSNLNAKDLSNKEIDKKSKIFISTSQKLININLGFDKMPKGFWAILIASASLFCMNAKVEDAGWGLFLAFLMLDKQEGLINFTLAVLGLAGMYQHIEGAGWLLFFAFLF
jgi:hypothetical protein